MTTDLPIPEASREVLYGFDYIGDDTLREFATPVVVAELLALADKVAALYAAGDDRYNAGHDDAIGAVREMIADRCDELGTKVEEL